MSNHPIPSAHFKKAFLRRLNAAGIFIISSTWLPAPGGDFANGETGYVLSDGRVRTLLEVLSLA